MEKLVERTRSFDRERPIDCRRWVEFTIIESTYRYHRIRYKRIDDGVDSAIGLQVRDAGERPATID